MEHGTSNGVSDDHHDLRNSARTEHDMMGNGSQQKQQNNHKRTLSSSILSKFNFLRSSTEDLKPILNEKEDQEEDARDANYAPRHAFEADPQDFPISWVQKTSKPRRRTGSLRKTAILGTGRIKAEGRERRNSFRRSSTTISIESADDVAVVSPLSDDVEPSEAVSALRRRFSYDNPDTPMIPPAASTTSTTWSSPNPSLSLDTTTLSRPSTASTEHSNPDFSSPMKSPTSRSNASTTDDDDGLSFGRSHKHGRHHHDEPTTLPGSSSSSSYFPSPDLLAPTARSTSKPLSPLSALPMDAYAPDTLTVHSYAETEWWGWIILLITWLFFVVGMGSCLGVWSWAWDVGEKPDAPPELEDDPTLPVVGYYPALIILSSVMAWVWVVVAWVGMKYFKHARVQGEE